jgi:hypothetical protein
MRSQYPDLQTDACLYASPERVPGEAMTSFLRRAAAQHRCSYRVLLGPLCLTAKQDPDFRWPWSIQSTARFLSTAPGHVMELIRWREAQIAASGRSSILGDFCSPRFRLCMDCVSQRGFVTYRPESRLTFISLCPVHGVPMVGPFQGDNEDSVVLERMPSSPEVAQFSRSLWQRERTLCALARSNLFMTYGRPIGAMQLLESSPA